MGEIEKVDLKSMDIAEDKLKQLKQLFPEVFSEKKVDFEKLKQVLGESIETGKERYGMNWAGKSDCIRIIQKPSIGTLKPCKEESVNFDSTENLFIEGDNLEVLKLLQKSYYGKVKMIYIDPPYNTGNDFIYPDDYSESLETYLKYTGQVDEEGRKFSTNTEDSGRFHTKWINMMYPRLYLAKNLLTEDGVIFISIDDHEIHNLRVIMDEIFGEENIVVQIAWQSRQSIQNDTDFSVNHEYIVAYAKVRRQTERRLKESNTDKWYTMPGFAAYPLPLDPSKFSNPDNDPRGPWKADPFDAPNIRPNLTYAIVNPKTVDEHWPPPGRCWRTDEVTYKQLLSDGRIVFGRSGDTRPQLKVFYEEKKAFGEVENSWFDGKSHGTATHGTKEIQELFDGKTIFDSPKPSTLIRSLLLISTKSGGLILDFFAGSCTTAQSVLELNREDGGNRHFIIVQLPEPTPDGSAARDSGYATIADIGKERIRRVINKIKEETTQVEFNQNKLDLGFKVFKLDKSNFKVWDTQDNKLDKEALERQLELHIDHIDPQSSQDDILFELLLKAGYELSTKTEKITIEGKTVFSIAEGDALICLEKELSKEVIKAMADKAPEAPGRVICLDAGFQGNDPLKTNAVQIMKSKNIEFRTV